MEVFDPSVSQKSIVITPFSLYKKFVLNEANTFSLVHDLPCPTEAKYLTHSKGNTHLLCNEQSCKCISTYSSLALEVIKMISRQCIRYVGGKI